MRRDPRVFKYELAIQEEQYVPLHPSDEILSVQVQRDTLCLWALIDAAVDHTDRRLVLIVGTGNPIPAPEFMAMSFVGTAQMFDGSLVWHVFAERAARSSRGEQA